jgi:hypothetical protein
MVKSRRKRRKPPDDKLFSKEEILNPLLELLQQYRLLRFGWDGAKGLPVTSKAIFTAATLLDTLIVDHQMRPSVTPLANGGVLIDWIFRTRAVSVEIEPNGDYQFTHNLLATDKRLKTNSPLTFTTTKNINEIKPLLGGMTKLMYQDEK